MPVAFSVTGPGSLNGNEVTITGAGLITVTASQPGNENCLPAPSVSLNFTVEKAGQVVTFPALTDKTFGDVPYAINASTTANLGVQWSVVSGSATMNGNVVTLTGVGPVRIKATQAGDDNFKVATEVENTFCSLPLKPTITANGNILTSSSLSGNQWLLDNKVIDGATATNYPAPESGKYSVIVSKDGCTSAVSGEFNLVITALAQPLLAKGIVLYPNPATERFTLNYPPNTSHGKVTATIYNAQGFLLSEQVRSSASGPVEFTFEVAALSAGTYFVRVVDATRVYVKALVKE